MEHETDRQILARRGVAHIDRCGCGMIQLGIGPVTVKLSLEAFVQVAEGVREAQCRLSVPSQQQNEGRVVPFAPPLL